MRIGFEAKRAFYNFTGLGNYSRTLLNNFGQYYPGNEYHLYSPAIRRSSRTDFLLENDAFHLHSSPTPFHFWWRSRALVHDLRRDKLDLFHGLSHELPFGIRHSGVPSIVTIHDLIFYHYPQHFGLWDRKVYHQKFRYACQKANHIVAISESTRRDILNYYQIEESKVSVIYQACEKAFYKRIPAEEQKRIRLQYQLPESYLLYVGSVIERKNLEGIFRSLQKLRAGGLRLNIVVIGGGSTYFKRMQKLAYHLGLSDDVYWRNEIQFADFPAVYQGAAMMVYPSFCEGFGLPVLEALASGLPVITSDRSSLPEAAGSGSICVDPAEVDSLAEAIEEVWQDKKLREKMIQSGVIHAAKFQAAELTKQYMELYEKIINLEGL